MNENRRPEEHPWYGPRVAAGLVLACVLTLPARAETLRDDAVRLIQQGHYEAAKALIKTRVNPQDDGGVLPLYLLGFCAEMQGQLEQACDLYRRAVLAQDASGTAGAEDEAKLAYQRLVKLRPVIKPVIEQVEVLETASREAGSAEEKRKLEQAAKALRSYALESHPALATVALSQSVKTEATREPRLSPRQKVEQALGYALSKAPGNATRCNHNGHYYLLVRGEFNWKQAAARCRAMGGYLATVNSLEEQEFITGYARESILLGASDERSEGQWEWVTGEPFTIKQWLPGEPNGRRHENALVMWLRPDPKNPKRRQAVWNDCPMNSTYGFVCEWEHR